VPLAVVPHTAAVSPAGAAGNLCTIGRCALAAAAVLIADDVKEKLVLSMLLAEPETSVTACRPADGGPTAVLDSRSATNAASWLLLACSWS